MTTLCKLRCENIVILEMDTFPRQTSLKDLQSCPHRIVFQSVDHLQLQIRSPRLLQLLMLLPSLLSHSVGIRWQFSQTAATRRQQCRHICGRTSHSHLRCHSETLSGTESMFLAWPMSVGQWLLIESGIFGAAAGPVKNCNFHFPTDFL